MTSGDGGELTVMHTTFSGNWAGASSCQVLMTSVRLASTSQGGNGTTLINNTFIGGISHNESTGGLFIFNIADQAPIDYGDCAPGTSPGEATANIALDGGDFTGCPVSCTRGTYGPGGPTRGLREIVTGCGVGCETCPAGAFCPSEALPAPVPCTPGFYNPDTGSQTESSCRPCASGTFQTEAGQTACEACPAGTFVSSKNATACSYCAAGGYCQDVGASSASVYEFCQQGTWSSTIGLNTSAGCHPCDQGTYQPVLGASSSDACIPCPLGTASATEGVAMCASCEPGSYQASAGMRHCEACPPETYCPMRGLSAPKPCPPGTYNDDFGARAEEDCGACPEGFWCSSGRLIDCPINTFNDRAGATDQSACTACPPNSVSPQGSTSPADCRCAVGYYDADVGIEAVSCMMCPVGSNCEVTGLSRASLPLVTGYWRVNASSVNLLRCPDASDDDSACIGGNHDLCKPWTAGPYCRLCNVTDGSRYYSTESSACLPCTGGTTAVTIVGIVGVVLALLLLLALLVRYRARLERLGQPLIRIYRGLNLQAKVKQLISLYQICTRIPDVFIVPLPRAVASLLSELDMLSLNITSFGLPLACLRLGTFNSHLLFVIVTPMILMLVITTGFACVALRPSKSHQPTAVQRLRAGVTASIPANLLVSFLAFPMTTSLAFQAFSCEDFDNGMSRLRADYAVDCNDGDQYGEVLRLAWAAIFIYPVGFPLVYLALLCAARDAILSDHPNQLSTALSWLHRGIEPRIYWWEIAEIVKKLFLVGFAALIHPGRTIQLIIGFAFCLVYLLFCAVCQPYVHDEDDFFSMLCNFVLTAVFFLCVVAKQAVLAEETGPYLTDTMHDIYVFDSGILSVALVSAVLSAAVVAIVYTIQQLKARLRKARLEAAAEREASAARGRMSYPPSCDWQNAEGNKYCTFLSHYKVEAGSDARYLSDLIRRMTGQPAYLDSTDLIDLRTLFKEGVHKTDALVILATKGVFTRPWCLMEMWEAAIHGVPIVLFPVAGGGWTLSDTRVLLSDLAGQMESRNPTCMAEVMAHVGKQGITDVREVEDVLLAHIGLVPTLERAGRPAAAAQLNTLLSSRLQRETGSLSSWLVAHNATVEERLEVLSWQSWGTDNQIIASVEKLMNECAAALGREHLEWKEPTTTHAIEDSTLESVQVLEDLVAEVEQGAVCKCFRRVSGQPAAPAHKDTGTLLIVCSRHECGGPARLLQRQLGERMQCNVVIATDQVEGWQGEVERASLGVVFLQSKSALRDPVRLLQLFEATRLRRPFVCVNVVGAGYDFATVKPLLQSLRSELSSEHMATLLAELTANNQGVGRLERSLCHAVPNAISVSFNPGAGDEMFEAASTDIVEKLGRSAELMSISQADPQQALRRSRSVLKLEVKPSIANAAVALQSSQVSSKAPVAGEGGDGTETRSQAKPTGDDHTSSALV